MTTETTQEVTQQELLIAFAKDTLQKLSNSKFNWEKALKVTGLISVGIVIGTMFGTYYAYEINPVVYYGANILDLDESTHKPITLGLLRILNAVSNDVYSIQLITKVMQDLYITPSMVCDTHNTYMSFTEETQQAINTLNIVCN